jgi:hypothetical protein
MKNDEWVKSEELRKWRKQKKWNEVEGIGRQPGDTFKRRSMIY